MALARLALKNLGQRVVVSPSSSSSFSSCSLGGTTVTVQKQQRWGGSSDHHQLLIRRLRLSTTSSAASATATAGDDQKSSKGGGSREVSVSVSVGEREGGNGNKFKLFPKRQRRRGLWKNTDHDDFVPALYEFFPSGLGNALMQATHNINMLLRNLTPSALIGQVKEEDNCYKLRFDVPGMGKENVKITVEDGVLTIKGEHEEEVEERSDDEQFSAKNCYYFIDTCIVLPEDAKAGEIKAQMKDGVLTIIVPRTERPKKEIKEVPIQ